MARAGITPELYLVGGRARSGETHHSTHRAGWGTSPPRAREVASPASRVVAHEPACYYRLDGSTRSSSLAYRARIRAPLYIDTDIDTDSRPSASPLAEALACATHAVAAEF